MESLTFILNWITHAFSAIASADTKTYGNVMSLIIILTLVYSLYKMHKSEDNPVDLTDLFIDPRTRKIDGSKFRLNVAFLLTCWVVVYTTLNNYSIEAVLGLFLTAWVVDRYNSRKAQNAIVEILKPKVDPQPEPTDNTDKDDTK